MKTILPILLFALPAVWANVDFAARVDDRSAIERVYHQRRLPQTRAFDEALPLASRQRMTQDEAAKRAVLLDRYDIAITAEMLQAECRRIDATTQAPQMLAEIKAALGDDPERFARAFAQPLLVDRLLREAFADDDRLHAPQRAKAAALRERLLAAKDPDQRQTLLRNAEPDRASEVSWLLKSGPTQNAPAPPRLSFPSEASARSAAYTVEATLERPQTLSPSPAPADQRIHFSDLDPELQAVLAVQLRQSGDVSAVIETPTAFLLYVASDRSESALSAIIVDLPKIDLEQWLSSLPIQL